MSLLLLFLWAKARKENLFYYYYVWLLGMEWWGQVTKLWECYLNNGNILQKICNMSLATSEEIAKVKWFTYFEARG